jgi:4'-phosphopantetheinyl transferase
MDVYWLEHSEADVPPHDDWLSAGEVACLNAMRIPKRRSDWRLGRWTAKRGLSLHLNLPGDAQSLASIEIRPAASGSPEAFIAGRPAAADISISHCNGTALCAIAPLGTALGCDLELVEPRSELFVSDYFTTEEQALLAQATAANRGWLVTLLWSAKESALKALHEGLRQDTRSVMVRLGHDIILSKKNLQPMTDSVDHFLSQDRSTWRPLEVGSTGGEIFHGWWRQTGNRLRTLLSAPAPNLPTMLKDARSG